MGGTGLLTNLFTGIAGYVAGKEAYKVAHEAITGDQARKDEEEQAKALATQEKALTDQTNALLARNEDEKKQRAELASNAATLQASRQRVAMQSKGGVGGRSTILTSPLGVVEDAAVGRKTLLGA